MTEINKQILNMIMENKTLNEISKSMHLTHKQIYKRLLSLEEYGYIIDRKYYYSGDIQYNLRLNLNDNIKENEVDIITSPNDNFFNALLISDLHLGSEAQSLDSLDKIYNYCIDKKINIIINCGDLVDGFNSHYNKISNPEDQINYALKVHPFDKNILNFLILGNHDIELFNNYGTDIKKVIYNKRHDIVPIGYRNGKINIKNDFLVLHHNITGGIYENDDICCYKLMLRGHSHISKHVFSHTHGNHIIYVPSLSNLKIDSEDNNFPKAIKMNIEFKDGKMWNVNFENLIILDKVYKVGEIDIQFKYKMKNTTDINLEDDIVDEYKVKKKQMSQINKFNQRYNL